MDLVSSLLRLAQMLPVITQTNVFFPQWKDEVRSHDPRLQRSGKHTDTIPELDITLKKLRQNSKERPV